MLRVALDLKGINVLHCVFLAGLLRYCVLVLVLACFFPFLKMEKRGERGKVTGRRILMFEREEMMREAIIATIHNLTKRRKDEGMKMKEKENR